MRLILLACAFTLFTLTSCSTAQVGQQNARISTPDAKENDLKGVDMSSGMDLTTYLRQISGVSIQGSGADAVIRIRGMSSFGSVVEPLYVVDGTVMGNEFSRVYNVIVDVDMIKRVEVLKSASETAEYGMQGGNGVIIFELK